MKKLRLNKSFISNLTRDEAGKIMGGNDVTWEECSDRCSDYCTTPTYGDATCYTVGDGCPGTGSHGCGTDNGCQSDLCTPDSIPMTECGPIC